MLFKGAIDMVWLLLQGCLPADHDTVCGGVRSMDSAQLLDDAVARPPSRAGLPSKAQPVFIQRSASARMLPWRANGEYALHRWT